MGSCLVILPRGLRKCGAWMRVQEEVVEAGGGGCVRRNTSFEIICSRREGGFGSNSILSGPIGKL